MPVTNYNPEEDFNLNWYTEDLSGYLMAVSHALSYGTYCITEDGIAEGFELTVLTDSGNYDLGVLDTELDALNFADAKEAEFKANKAA